MCVYIYINEILSNLVALLFFGKQIYPRPASLFSCSSHADAGAGDSPGNRILCAEHPLWGAEPAARGPRYREHTAGEGILETTLRFSFS